MNTPSQASASLELSRSIVNLLDSLSALNGLTEITLGDIDEHQLLKHALESLMSNQDMERCSIFLLGEDGVLTNAVGMDWNDMLWDIIHPQDMEAANLPRATTRFRLGEGIMGRAAETGQVEHCRSCAGNPQFKQLANGGKPFQGSLICVPILCEDKVYGVLNVYYPQPEFFTLWHERLLMLFCRMLGHLLVSHRFIHRLSALVDQKTHELAQQHRFLQDVINGMAEPVMVIGADYQVMLSNRPVFLEQHYCYQMSHQRETPCDGTELVCPLERVMREDRQVRVVHKHFDQKGNVRYMELLSSPLKDDEGNIIGIIESSRDITDRLLAERELQDLNETLEQRVEDAVRQKTEQEQVLIRQSRFASMGEMISNIAHQWRQPLNALSLLLGNIQDAYEHGELDDTYLKEAVRDGGRLIQQMSITIDDFRNFFRPNKEKSSFSLSATIHDTLSLVGHALENHEIKVELEVDEDISAHGFPNEFSQVLLNLVTNAKDTLLERKVAPGEIRIALHRDGDLARIVIADNGGGIPEEALPKVFDPYFTTREKGTGIGLYMSKMITAHMNGSIEARNIPGGAQFTVSLPVAE